MRPNAARKAKIVRGNTGSILAIEAVAACQALEVRKPLKPGRAGRFLYQMVREVSPPISEDRYFHKDIEAVSELIRSGKVNRGMKKANLI